MGRRASSSTYTRAPASGRPIGGLTAPASGSLTVAQTVVSVGPYALSIRRPADQRSTSSGGQASPAVMRVRPSGIGSPTGQAASTVGGRQTTSMPAFATSSASGSPGARSASAASTRTAPVSSAVSSSQAAASKLNEANCSSRVPSPTPKRSCSAASAATARCGTSTPLGRPVEPEV